jgi:hypothetical protein
MKFVSRPEGKLKTAILFGLIVLGIFAIYAGAAVGVRDGFFTSTEKIFGLQPALLMGAAFVLLCICTVISVKLGEKLMDRKYAEVQKVIQSAYGYTLTVAQVRDLNYPSNDFLLGEVEVLGKTSYAAATGETIQLSLVWERSSGGLKLVEGDSYRSEITL